MRPRILLVTPMSPYTTSSGGHQRSHLMWRALSGIGDVDVVVLSRGDTNHIGPASDGSSVAEGTFKVGALGINTFMPEQALVRGLRSRLALERYDVVCARHLAPVSRLEFPGTMPVIVDLDDVNYLHRAASGAFGRAAVAGESALKRFLVRRALSRFSRFWFVSEKDRAAFPEVSGGILPNIPIPPRRSPTFASSGATVLFVGALTYPPNRLGVDRFLAACWPRIRAAVPAASLRLVGWLPEAERQRLERAPGVHAPGFVPDLDEEYANAALVVAPIHTGGGTNIKVLEAMAHGRACVTTTFCLGGFLPHLDGASDVIAAGTEEEMAATCIRLLNGPAEREALARRAHAIVGATYSQDMFDASVREQVHACIGGKTVYSHRA